MQKSRVIVWRDGGTAQTKTIQKRTGGSAFRVTFSNVWQKCAAAQDLGLFNIIIIIGQRSLG